MKHIYKLTMVALTSLVLASCDISFDFSSPFLTSSSNNYIPPESEGGFYKPTSYSISPRDYIDQADLFSLQSKGVQKILVIPVTFSDYRCGANCSTLIQNIEKTFFGESEDTGWESVASFYEKSSYGQLQLTGTVTPVYDSSYTADQFANLTRSSGDYYQHYDPTWTMVDEAVAWYKSLTGSNLTEYDQLNNGFIDAVYLIYNNPNAKNTSYTQKGQDVFWAYTYWNYGNYYLANINNPKAMTYAWSSYDFMYTAYGSSSVDAHIYIHEMGHILGLDDYYSYDDDDDWGSLGGVDMMDFNIVDHNAFSKFFLGWIDPFVIDGSETSTTIALDPFESSGEFILIKNNWNGSVFDDYLLIEFYTPTGLNYKDSRPGGYPGNNLRAFSVEGIKIMHVDARLGLYNYSNSFEGYTDTLNHGVTKYTYIAASNTASFSQFSNFKLIHLLEATGTNSFINNKTATNNTLFTSGQSFTPSSFSHFFPISARFNDGSQIGYSITVNDVSSTQAVVTITIV
jgi:M6 family metalloprotease-like protein